ncbi:MAG: cytochrome c [Burkholderiaceae bacterium]|jgi:mono/diheme cytochrome c family protein|nr:cytochrome c [Burkholderiaceae bacterium]MCU0965669.1 cytochrome c [Burkholderiaceae bacterium]
MKRALAALGGVVLLLMAALWWLNVRGDDSPQAATADLDSPAQIERGAYLARAGNCQDCHTPRGAEPYSGGRGIPTPFGTVFSSNLTPDPQTGLGHWSATDFRRALHNGRSRDGRLLYPAFPYDAYTRISAADADALFAYLRSLPAVARPNRPQALRFPFDTQAALAVWRALYFRSGRFEAQPQQSAEWNRGAYLVQGLGHCSACHAGRNALGATRDADALAGGLIALQNWFAPALGGGSAAQVAALLQSGVAEGAAMLGPMAEVVLHSTQHLSPADLRAMAHYLQSRPRPEAPRATTTAVPPARLERGAKIYEKQCVRCHGADGQGVARAYVPLAGNRAVLQDPPANLVQVVLGGAFAPSTAGNPRPFGMSPFATELGDEDIAAVLSYIRNAWGNQAGAVQALDVQRWRSSVRP